MAQALAPDKSHPRPEQVHHELYAWRASLLSVIGRDATHLGGDVELQQARVEVLALLDRRIVDIENRCEACGASELCDCEVSLT